MCVIIKEKLSQIKFHGVVVYLKYNNFSIDNGINLVLSIVIHIFDNVVYNFF